MTNLIFDIKGESNSNICIIYVFTFLLDKYTVKPVLSGHSKIDKTTIFMTNGSLMKVESSAECSPWSILQYF